MFTKRTAQGTPVTACHYSLTRTYECLAHAIILLFHFQERAGPNETSLVIAIWFPNDKLKDNKQRRGLDPRLKDHL